MPSWKDQAGCADPSIPTGMFFPGPYDHEERDAALAVCDRCPVVDECAAASRDEKHGIWGGLTEADRSPLQGKSRPFTHGTARGYRVHLRRGETPCQACQDALDAVKAAHAADMDALLDRTRTQVAEATARALSTVTTERSRRVSLDKAAGRMLDQQQAEVMASADAQTKI